MLLSCAHFTKSWRRVWPPHPKKKSSKIQNPDFNYWQMPLFCDLFWINSWFKNDVMTSLQSVVIVIDTKTRNCNSMVYSAKSITCLPWYSRDLQRHGQRQGRGFGKTEMLQHKSKCWKVCPRPRERLQSSCVEDCASMAPICCYDVLVTKQDRLSKQYCRWYRQTKWLLHAWPDIPRLCQFSWQSHFVWLKAFWCHHQWQTECHGDGKCLPWQFEMIWNRNFESLSNLI